MSLIDIMLGKKLNTKVYILYDSCSFITGKNTVKNDMWLPLGEVGVGLTEPRPKETLWGDRNILYLSWEVGYIGINFTCMGMHTRTHIYSKITIRL